MMSFSSRALTLKPSKTIFCDTKYCFKKNWAAVFAAIQDFPRLGDARHPEYFWESDEYEPLYAKARTWRWTSEWVLNQKLDIVRAVDMLSQALENYTRIGSSG